MKQQKKPESKTILYIFLGAVCLSLLCLLFYGSSLPYVGYNAWNFNIYSLIAHNYNSFGFFATKFAPIVSVGSVMPQSPSYYLNHPPLLSILIALVFRIAGESFWSGRLVNIIAAFSSCVLLYGIARQIAGVMYARIIFVLCLFIPAVTVFGRMIGHESLVLFFALLFLYSILVFHRTRRKAWFIIGITSAVLGTLTDWAMVYLMFCIMIFFIYKKEKKIALLSFVISILTAMSYFVYAYLITGDVTFLTDGFLNRSAGQLLHRDSWGFVWITTLFSRLLIYFNPFLVGLFLIYFLRFRNSENHNVFILTSSLSLFGLLHLALYPEGSYGHPYWMYYLFPSIALGSGVVLQKLWKNHKSLLAGGLLLSSMYAVMVVQWKTQEVTGNVFRYELAKIASARIPDYAPILINRTGLVDPDIFQYSFRHPTVILEPRQNKIPDLPFEAVVYSCLPSCNDEHQLSIFKENYGGTRFVGRDIEMWVLTKYQGGKPEVKTERIAVSLPESSQSFFSKLYQKAMQFSSAPQL